MSKTQSSSQKAPVHKIEVVYRYSACRCGCHGKDPWHAKSFKRIPKTLRPATQEDQGRDITLHGEFGSTRLAGAVFSVATVDLPWAKDVEVIYAECYPNIRGVLGWYIAAPKS